jgi:uncharacterized membrane protein
MPHLHLLLNHVPTVGTVIAVAILLLSLLRRNEGMRRVSFELYFVIALLTLPAYLSGVGTEAILEYQEGVSRAIMERHHDAALLGSVFMLLSGGAAWIALWQTRRRSRPSGVTVASVLLLSAVTVDLKARAATLGGEIRHPEIVGDPEASLIAAEPYIAATVAGWVTGKTWLWPACEAIHFIGLWLLFGVVALTNLRLLGVMSAAPFAAFHRLLPWAALGLGVNAVTGMMFVVAAPGQYLENIAFFWKIGLLLLAGGNLLYLTVFDAPWAVKAGDHTPFTGKALAAISIAAWIGVMYFGRMLPFIGNAF